MAVEGADFRPPFLHMLHGSGHQSPILSLLYLDWIVLYLHKLIAPKGVPTAFNRVTPQLNEAWFAHTGSWER